jgi:maltose/moltooligosaccharide transporter
MSAMTGRRIPFFLGASLAVGVFNAFNNFTLPLWLSGFTSSYILISLLANSRSVESAVVSPLAGALSDRTWLGWLGRRRPFLLVGGLLAALLLALTPVAGAAAGLVGVAAALLLATVAFNVADDVHKALMADLTAPARRSWLSSLMVVTDIGGQVAVLMLGFLLWSDRVPDAAFVAVAAVMVGGVVATVLGVPEVPPPAADPDAPAPGRLSLRGNRAAAFFLLVAFFYWSGVNAVLPLVSIYVRDILGATTGEAQLLPGLLLLSTTAMALPMGWLGGRFGKRRLLAFGYASMGAAAVAGLFITTIGQGVALFLIAGIGNAAVIVLAVPLMADLVPRQHLGVATGLLAAVGSVAAPVAALAGGGLSELYGPRAIFAVMAATSLAAIALLPATRSDQPPG